MAENRTSDQVSLGKTPTDGKGAEGDLLRGKLEKHRRQRALRDVGIGILFGVAAVLVEYVLLKREEAWIDGLVLAFSFLAVVAFVFSYRRLKEARQDLLTANAGLQAEIEERTRTGDALRKSEKRFAVAFNASPVPTMISDAANGQILDVNDQFIRTLGYSREELLGRTALELGLWKDASDRAGLGEKIERKGAALFEEVQLRTRSGEIRDVFGSVVRVDVGSLQSALSTFIDITDRKRAERALRDSEERYRLLFEKNPEPMWVFDEETLAFLAVNEGACRHYGYSREEFLRMTIRDIRRPDQVGALLAQLAGETQDHENAGVFKHSKKDGTLIEVEITSDRLIFDGRSSQLVVAIDVTERRQLESQLRQSQKMEGIGQLAGGVAHDFNNLLTAILGYAELLDGRQDLDAAAHEDVAEIRNAGQRATALTRQLLAFSRKQVLEPVILDVNGLVADLERMLGRLIGENANLITRLDPAAGNVRADPGQLEQVIMNLVVNARDAMPGGGKLTIETANTDLDEAYAQRHATVRPGRYVMIAVSDTGTGMDATTQQHIFEPFFTTKEKGKGTGLGLSTVYGIVKQSGGNIWVYSELGKGTTFKVYLPLVEEVTAVRETHPSSSHSAAGNETILLVEDEESIRLLSRRILEERGYRVIEAATGELALEAARKYAGHIDLLVTDLIMPGMSGTELASSLLDANPDIRVLFVSGYTDDGVVRSGFLGTGRAFLQKPFTPKALAGKVREVLS